MHGNSYAAFVQTDWKFLPTWKLTTGVRYTEDFLAGTEYVRELCFGIPSCLAFPNTLLPAQCLAAPLRRSTISPHSRSPTGPYRGVTNQPELEPNGNWVTRTRR